MQKKNIWVFHHYATPPSKSGLVRPYNFASHTINEGYKTTVFSASYLHYSDINLIEDKELYKRENYLGIDFVYVNTPSSAKGTISRISNMLSYYRNIYKVSRLLIEKDKERPDIIYASSPHPLALIAGIKISKKLKVPNISEIRDLWPEAIFAFGKAKEKSLLGKILIAGEKWIYKNSDALIFLKEGDTDYLKERGWLKNQGGSIDLEKCNYINNGVDIESFKKQMDTNVYQDEDLDAGKFNVIYAGAIRPLNNVGNILDAAKLLGGYKDIQFLIYGDGNQVDMLKKRISDENISNVKIKGYVDKKYIPSILARSSVNILNYSQDKYNWSRGNSSNKLFEYMASGKPIISTVKMGYSPLEKYDCGIALEKDTPDELAKMITEIYEMPKVEYLQKCNNAITGANDFDYRILAKKLINVFEKLVR